MYDLCTDKACLVSKTRIKGAMRQFQFVVFITALTQNRNKIFNNQQTNFNVQGSSLNCYLNIDMLIVDHLV